MGTTLPPVSPSNTRTSAWPPCVKFIMEISRPEPELAGLSFRKLELLPGAVPAIGTGDGGLEQAERRNAPINTAAAMTNDLGELRISITPDGSDP